MENYMKIKPNGVPIWFRRAIPKCRELPILAQSQNISIRKVGLMGEWISSVGVEDKILIWGF
jgi:hypothetical protein